jgi:DNA (cytosine-5)-methyltransferase 1
VATAGAISLIEPFILPQFGEATARSVDRPVGTITTTSRGVGLVEPFLLNLDHQSGGDSVRDVDKPIPTQTTKARTCLVEPFVVPFFGERENQKPRSHSVDDPLPTVTSHGAGALVEPFILPNEGIYRGNRARSTDEPLNTVTASRGAGHLVEPFLTKFYGTAKAASVNDPLDSVTTRDRFALVTTEAGQFYVDIRFRMLQPRELARAQGFADSYQFKGNREEVVKQIGNAVPVNMAEALCRSLLAS